MSETSFAPIRTTCPYCGVGCGVNILPKTNGGFTVKPDKLHPANLGRLCSKGMALAETLDHPQRLLQPQIADQAVSWDQATTEVADRLSAITAEHGPDSVAFYVSGQLLTEDYYVANKLMKGFIGAANIDTNSRLCMSSAVVAHKRAFGEDLVPCSYEDLELCDLIVLVGSNTAWCHPVLYQRMVLAKKNKPSLKVVLELASRRSAMQAKGNQAWKPVNRDRQVSAALKAYAAMTTSASRGAVRDVSQLDK